MPNTPTDDELKAGRRNSASDAARLQAIHDYAVENGAKCGIVEGDTEGKHLSHNQQTHAGGGGHFSDPGDKKPKNTVKIGKKKVNRPVTGEDLVNEVDGKRGTILVSTPNGSGAYTFIPDTGKFHAEGRSNEVLPPPDLAEKINNFAGFKSIELEETDTLIFYGAEVKALGDGRVGGYLLRYSGANDPDLTGDYFSAETYTGKAEQLDVYYQHGLDPQLGKRVIGEAKAKRDDVGLWVEAQLNMRDAYEKQIYELARAGKLGWSSGAVSHLVERKAVGNAYHVTRWPIAEASLTPTPAEPRNAAISLKSLTNASGNTAGQPTPDGARRAETTPTPTGANTMPDILTPEMAEALSYFKAKQAEEAEQKRQAEIKAEAAKMAEAELKKLGIVPGNTPAPHIAPVNDPEKEKASYKAAFHAYLTRKETPAQHAQLKALSEGTDTAGGFLVPEDFRAELLAKLPGLTALFRLVGRKQTGRDTLVLPKRVYTTDNKYTAGTRLTWTGEIPASATAARVTSNVYGQVRIPVHTGMMSEIVYRDVMEDSAIDIEADLRQTFLENLAQDMEYYLAQGTGVGQPEGITINSTARTNSVNSGSAAALTADGLKGLLYGVPAQYRRGGVWVFNTSTLLAIMKLKDSNGRYLLEEKDMFGGGLGSMQPEADGTMLGKKFYVSEQMPDIAANAYPIVFGDLSGYTIADRVGFSLQRLDELYAETNAVAFVLRTRMGGQVTEDYRFKLQKVAA